MAGLPEPLACSVRELVRRLIELPAANASALLRHWLESLRGQPDAMPGVTREASLRQPVARLSELLAQHYVFAATST